MKNLALRLTLVVLAVAGVAGSGYLLYSTENQVRRLQAGASAIDREATRVRSVVAEIRASQPGYFVPGQDRNFWVSKVGALVKEAQAGAAALAQSSDRTADAGEELATAAEALGSFARFDARVRELLSDGQPLTAGTLAFSDAWQLLGAADRSLGQVRRLQSDAAERSVVTLRQRQMYIMGGAAGWMILVLLLLAPRVRQTNEVQDLALDPRPSPADDLMLNGSGHSTPANGVSRSSDRGLALSGDPDLGDGVVSRARKAPLPAEAMARTGGASSSASGPSAPQPAPGMAASPAGSTPGRDATSLLAQAAALCNDLAKVESGNELQQALERAGSLLDASGIVLWLATDGALGALQPAMSWGYAPGVLAKMRALPRDGENAVSSAVRLCRVEVVPAAAKGNGAIVVPLQSANSCRGAMAVETRNRGEASDVLRSLATIVAAQIAAFLPEAQA